jgi:hypothetical protein
VASSTISLERAMNATAIFADQIWRNRSLVLRTRRPVRFHQEAVVNAIYFVLAVGATSAGIFALMTRADRINRRRGPSDGGASDSSVNDSAVRSWFGPYGGGRNDW